MNLRLKLGFAAVILFASSLSVYANTSVFERKTVFRLDEGGKDPATGKLLAIQQATLPSSSDWQIAQTFVIAENAKQEAALLKKNANQVHRKGPKLNIGHGKQALELKSFEFAGDAKHEGNSEIFTYAGSIADSNLHRVDIHYAHDHPFSLIVNPTTGKQFFFSSAFNASGFEGDQASVSPDGQYLLNVQGGNFYQYQIVLADLQALSQAFAFRCVSSQLSVEHRMAKRDDQQQQLQSKILAWLPAPNAGVRFALTRQLNSEEKTYQFELLKENAAWKLSSDSHADVEKELGLRCWTYKVR